MEGEGKTLFTSTRGREEGRETREREGERERNRERERGMKGREKDRVEVAPGCFLARTNIVLEKNSRHTHHPDCFSTA